MAGEAPQDYYCNQITFLFLFFGFRRLSRITTSKYIYTYTFGVHSTGTRKEQWVSLVGAADWLQVGPVGLMTIYRHMIQMIYILSCRQGMLCRTYVAQIQPREHVLSIDHADFYGSHAATWARSYRSYRSYSTDHTDHTDQDLIYLT